MTSHAGRTRSSLDRIPGRRCARAGFSILEIVLTMTVLLIAVGATVGSISSFAVLGDAARETTGAYLEAQRAVERMRAETFGEVFALFNDDPTDDPGGVGTAPGPGFAVELLNAQVGDADGLVGRIEFPVLAGAPGVLREDLNEPGFGLPRDLDGDGAVDAFDHGFDYRILPVRVRLEWRGKAGNRFVEIQTTLND